MVGPNLRFLTRLINEVDAIDDTVELMTQAVALCSPTDVIMLLDSHYQEPIPSLLSHSLVITRRKPRPNDKRKNHTVQDLMEHRIHSPLTLRLLLASYSEGRVVELRKLCDLFTGGSMLSVPRGWAFESLGHHHIWTRGNDHLPLVPMTFEDGYLRNGVAIPHNLQVGSRVIQTFTVSTGVQNTSSLDAYYIPTEGNNPTFDSFLHTSTHMIGFQMTVGREHSLNAIGLNRLIDRARPDAEYQFVFVIPEGQDIEVPSPTPTRSPFKHFDYFTLEISCGESFLGNAAPFFFFLSNMFLRL